MKHLRASGGPDLTGAIQLPPFPDARIQTFTAPEIERAIAKATPGMRLFILLALDAGLRFSTATHIAAHNWNAQSKTLTFQTKGKHNMSLPATPRLAKFLDAACATAQPGESLVKHMFGHRNSENEISDSAIRRKWHRFKLAAGIRRELWPHDLRRTAATNLYNQTHDIRAVQQFLGHRSLLSTIHYLAPHDPTSLRKLIQDSAVRFSMRSKP